MSVLSATEAHNSRSRSARLDDVLTIIRGVSYKKDDASSTPASNTVPVLRATNIQDGTLVFNELVHVPRKYVSDEQLLRRGDIVVAASSGSRSVVGKAASLKIDWQGSFGAFCFGLRPKSGIDPNYLAWFLQTSEYRQQVSELAAGVNINNLRAKHIQEIPIPVPSIEQQKQIVTEIEKQFTRLDAGVAALRRVQANLKRYRAAILKAACEGRLVPTEAELAKAEGRSFETGEQLLARILADRRKNWQGRGKYKEPVAPNITNLPPLPEGWAWCMSDALFFFVTSGSRGWAKYYSNDGAIFLRIGNLEHENIRLYLDDTQRVSPPVGAEGSRTRVQANDILISITADVGMIGLVPSGLGEAYINQHVALARPLPAANAKFIAYYLCASEGGWREFLKLQRGATKVGLGLDDIQLVPVPLPPPAEQTRIVAEVERRLSVIEELDAAVAANLSRATRLRQSILQRAFSAEPSRREPSGLDARKQA